MTCRKGVFCLGAVFRAEGGRDCILGAASRKKRKVASGSWDSWAPAMTLDCRRIRKFGVLSRKSGAVLGCREILAEAPARNPRPLGSAADSVRAPRLGSRNSRCAADPPLCLRAKAVFVQAETGPASQGVGDLRRLSRMLFASALLRLSHLDPKALEHGLPLLSGLGLESSWVLGPPRNPPPSLRLARSRQCVGQDTDQALFEGQETKVSLAKRAGPALMNAGRWWP